MIRYIALVLAQCLALIVADVACTPSQVKTATDVTTKIAEDTCHDLADAGQDPEWVELVCVGIGAAGGVVHVLLPRKQWTEVRARSAAIRADAGPGK